MRTWLSRIGELLFRRRREERLSDEIGHHLDLLVEDLKRGGMSDADARLAARKQFGGVDQLRMSHREQRGMPVVETLLQDIRFALRVLMRDRGFALTAIVVLGVGLGVNNMFFTLVYAHKFRGLPIERTGPRPVHLDLRRSPPQSRDFPSGVRRIAWRTKELRGHRRLREWRRHRRRS